jgi:hypothetical protein
VCVCVCVCVCVSEKQSGRGDARGGLQDTAMEGKPSTLHNITTTGHCSSLAGEIVDDDVAVLVVAVMLLLLVVMVCVSGGGGGLTIDSNCTCSCPLEVPCCAGSCIHRKWCMHCDVKRRVSARVCASTMIRSVRGDCSLEVVRTHARIVPVRVCIALCE